MLLGVFLPFFNFVTLALYGRRLGKMGSLYLTFATMTLLVCVNVYNFVMVVFTPITYFFNLGVWMQVGLLQVNWEFMLDFLAVSMLLMVSLVSWAVHVYSFAYMKTDPHFIRFLSYLSLFTFFMFVIVTSANLVVLFVGWEGVGICSYLLINFWYTRGQANKAALKALLMNRVGDLGFLAGMLLLFTITGAVDFAALTVLLPIVFEDYNYIFFSGAGTIYTYLDVICFFFFIGVAGKSAQLGLHTWLPAAMEGPTPVSALIHAATMVTAGIFLIIRCSFLFECSSKVQALVVILGALTAFISAVTAMFLFDIKKIIAYSTCSQLGYMAVACGLSEYSLGLFHLINHAFFKALLFLTAGAIIHTFNNEQDIRKLSLLGGRMPFIHTCMLAGTIAIMGLPFLSGFYSKDVIIEIVYLKAAYILEGSWLIYGCIMGATLCTGLYSFRLYYFLFLRAGTLHKSNLFNIKRQQQPFFIQVALCSLLAGSIFSGYFLNDVFLSSNTWSISSTLLVGNGGGSLENEFLPWYIKLFPFFCNCAVLCLGIVCVVGYQKGLFVTTIDWLFLNLYVAYDRGPVEVRQQYQLVHLCLSMQKTWFKIAQCVQFNFYFNEVYNYLGALQFTSYFTFFFFNLDKGGFELYGPTGLERCYKFIIKLVKRYYKQGMASHLSIMYFTLLVGFYIIELLF